MAAGLARMNEEDPSFSVVNNPETRQVVLSGTGDMQLDVLVSRLTDGSSVTFAERYILPRLQQAIDELEAEGCRLIMFFCTGKFPETLTSRNIPLIYPCDILDRIVPLMTKKSNIICMTPSPLQLSQTEGKWSQYVDKVTSIAASPYGPWEDLEKAAEQLRIWAYSGNDKIFKRAQSMEKRIERMRTTDRPTRERKMEVRFGEREFRGDEVLVIKDLKKGFEGRTLFDHVNLLVEGGERIALIGDNGTGKST